MTQNSELIINDRMVKIMQRTLNYVDPRLMDHGGRVAYAVYRMLKVQGKYQGRQLQEMLLLALLHDIGAYKTEEIERMTDFETRYIWDHSIYGYLLLRHFSPLKAIAPAVLFHHADWTVLKEIPGLSDLCRELSQIINIADRADIYFENVGYKPETLSGYLRSRQGRLHDQELVELYLSVMPGLPRDGREKTDEQYQNLLQLSSCCEEEILQFVQLLVSAIDFRSYHTVTHTIITTAVSGELARLLDLPPKERQEIHYGAMLHDLGKVGIPAEILESPGSLSPEEMAVMRTHVDITEKILHGNVAPAVELIALRHHEKLDGSGYPRGLTAKALTTAQRTLAVADIISALTGARSYKEAFPKERTIRIIRQMASQGKLDEEIVELAVCHLDEIMAQSDRQCRPILEAYHQIQQEYGQLRQSFSAGVIYCPAGE
ncbi:MAG: HD domain-containing protein [Peptococcaceae bacterium]|nr:HD domain-containing protein [Peptococcaceae bacterium]